MPDTFTVTVVSLGFEVFDCWLGVWAQLTCAIVNDTANSNTDTLKYFDFIEIILALMNSETALIKYIKAKNLIPDKKIH